MGLPGFEPGLAGPKPAVIAKLHHSPITNDGKKPSILNLLKNLEFFKLLII